MGNERARGVQHRDRAWLRGLDTLLFRGLLSTASPHIRHLAIDPNQIQRFAAIGLQLIDEAGLRDRLDFYAEPSEIALPRLLAEGRQFDFAFVDGNHRFHERTLARRLK